MNEGASGKFEVVVKNKFGREVSDPRPIAVTVDTPALLTAFAYDVAGNVIDLTAGVVDGTVNIIATDGTLTSAPYPVTITADNTPASLEVRPKA